MGFWQGFGSILDLLGVGSTHDAPLPPPLTDEEAWERDRQALASDWEAIGNDLWRVMEQHTEEP